MIKNAALFQKLRNLGVDIDAQINEVVEWAKSQDIPPLKMRTPNGDFVMAPLLVAKSNVLLALSNLEKS